GWTVKVRELFAGSRESPPRSQPAGEAKGTQPAGVAGTGGVPPEEFIKLACAAGSPTTFGRDLRQAQEQLEQALHGLEIRFESPGPQLGGKRLAELPVESLRRRLAELRERVGELADWIDWRHLGGRFAHLGLTTLWEALRTTTVPRDRQPDVFLKAALGAWLEHVFQQDPALGQFRSQDHERVLSEFRELDRRLIRAAAERVARLADAGKPEAPLAVPGSEVAVLM